MLLLATISAFVIASYRWPILSSGVGLNSRGLVSPTSDRVLASSYALFRFPSLALHHSPVTTQTEIRAGITTWVRATRTNTDIRHLVNN